MWEMMVIKRVLLHFGLFSVAVQRSGCRRRLCRLCTAACCRVCWYQRYRNGL